MTLNTMRFDVETGAEWAKNMPPIQHIEVTDLAHFFRELVQIIRFTEIDKVKLTSVRGETKETSAVEFAVSMLKASFVIRGIPPELAIEMALAFGEQIVNELIEEQNQTNAPDETSRRSEGETSE